MTTINFTKGRAKVYLKAINGWKRKYMSVSDLSKLVGIYEDVVRDQLATFDPMIRLMDDVNVLTLKGQLEEYASAAPKKVVKKNKGAKANYKGVVDFVYRNMTLPGGIVDSSVQLTFEQLKELKRVVNEEYKAKKPE